MTQSFDIPWPPTAKGRPKFVRRTGAAYTPGETRHAEAAIRDLLVARGAICYERGVPLVVDMVFSVKRPASAPKRSTRPTKRPDLDQYVKLLLDAAAGILWSDDAQIVDIRATKTYTMDAPHQSLIVAPVDIGL